MTIKEIPPRPASCPLMGFRVSCTHGVYELHHMIPKGKARGNRKVRRYIDKIQNLVWVCKGHNSSEKWADTPEARALLLAFLCEREGEEVMRDYLAGIPWKVPMHDMTFDGIMAGYPQEILRMKH